MQALTRLTQKSINMEIMFKPVSISYTPAEVNEGEPCEIYLEVTRGPLTWNSEKYDLNSDETEIQFREGDKFNKKSGFYFTKEGAEYKKATIKVMKSTADGEAVELTSNDINLSGLICLNAETNHIEIHKNGFITLTAESKIYPSAHSDQEFVNSYLENLKASGIAKPRISSVDTGSLSLMNVFRSNHSQELEAAKKVQELEQRD